MSRRRGPSRKARRRERREAARRGLSIEELRRRNANPDGGRGVRRRAQSMRSDNGPPAEIDPARFERLAEGGRP